MLRRGLTCRRSRNYGLLVGTRKEMPRGGAAFSLANARLPRAGPVPFPDPGEGHAVTDDIFSSLYASYEENVLRAADQKVRAVFEEWAAEGYWARYAEAPGVAAPSPIHRTKTRVKRPESLLDKFKRLASEFPDGPTEDALPLIRDFLGARVVVYFPTHLRYIDEELRSGRHFEISREYPPRSYLPEATLLRIGLDVAQFQLKGRKPSGYASLHYVVRLVNPPHGASRNPWFELQTRTMLEDVWGEVEHQLGYKPNQQTEFSVSRQFQVISSHLSAVDDHFDFLYDRLTFLQARANPQADDELNAENLPKVLEGVECYCEQDEIDGLLSILESHEIRTVRDFTLRARPDVVEAIRNTYSQLAHGKKPTAFHVVASIAPLGPHASPQQATRVLRGNLNMVELTRRTRDQRRNK